MKSIDSTVHIYTAVTAYVPGKCAPSAVWEGGEYCGLLSPTLINICL